MKKICLMALCAFLMSCTYRNNNDQRTIEETKTLKMVSDSVNKLSPNASKLIQNGLKMAKDSMTYYDYLLLRGRSCYLSGHTDSAIPYIGRTIKFAEHQKSSSRVYGLKGEAYETEAGCRYTLHKSHPYTIKLYHKAYELIMKSDKINSSPEFCANMADAYQQCNKIPEASLWYRRALYLVDSLKLPQERNVSLYLGLAGIYQNLNDMKQARMYYEYTQRRFKSLYPNMQIYFLNNYGNYYYYMKDYNNALKMFLRMKKTVRKEEGMFSLNNALCSINLADVYFNLNKYNLSKYYLDKAQPYFERENIDVGIFYAKTIRLALLLKDNKINEAKKLLNNEKIKKIDDPQVTNIRDSYLRDFYIKTGNYKKAYLSLLRTIHEKDSIEYNRSYMRASEIMMRFAQDTLLLHHKMYVQKKDLEMHKIQYKLWMTTSLVLILILMLAYWLMISHKRKMQNELDIMHLRLANARNRISPHFIFNVLNNKIMHTNKQEADELIMLVKLIRANLNISKNVFITLKDEMDFVNYYVEIEKAMLGDDFSFDVSAPKNDIMKKIMVPSMFIQILVENAIKHGLKNKEGHKQLDIIIHHDGYNTDIFVKDNGMGFDIRKSDGSSTRTGLHIIRTSILLINSYNRHRKISFKIHNIISKEGHIEGCENILHIPTDLKMN